MGFKAALLFHRAVPAPAAPPPAADAERDEKPDRGAGEHGTDDDAASVDAQAGVQQATAAAKVWTRNHIILAYVLIWVISFVNSMEQGMGFGLTPYVTSDFQLHSLTAATGIMAHLIGGLFKLPLAKILDIWGRPQGFTLSTGLLTLGLLMMAACNNVQTYAAAQVFYWVGMNGMSYSLHIFIADTSALKNRGFMFAFYFSPFIVTSWISGPVATNFLYGAGWRWGFGTFAIVTPVMTLPLIALFTHNYRKAKAMGLMPARPRSGDTLAESARYYLTEFDVVGIFLIASGLALFLLPFSLYSYQPDKWRSPMIVCMIVFGLLLLVCFVLYEKFLAPVQFLPYRLLVDRTIIGSMVLAASMFIAFFIWDNYFSSFLQVVNGLSLTEATYVGKIFTIGSCIWGLVVGLLIRVSGRFKWLALYFGMPLTILGTGLMMHFRQPHANVGYVVMCQVFIALAGGTVAICEQMAVMATVTHQHVAVILAVLSMCSSIGGGIGSTIAAALWTGIFPRKLAELLPPESKANLTDIYGSLPVQLSYPVGSATRDAINQAYGETQKTMLIAAIAVLFVALAAVAFWRDIRVKDFKHSKKLVA